MEAALRKCGRPLECTGTTRNGWRSGRRVSLCADTSPQMGPIPNVIGTGARDCISGWPSTIRVLLNARRSGNRIPVFRPAS